MKIINSNQEDYHIHSITFSDGMNSVDEIVKFVGDIGMKKIAITDHSQALLDHFGISKKTWRSMINRWQNVQNEVEVVFGVECDLLNSNGDVCFDIDGDESDFNILALHSYTYIDDPSTYADGLIKAIDRYHDKIKFIGHPMLNLNAAQGKMVIDEANKFGLPLELNALCFLKNPDNWEPVIKYADQVYVNSDAHTLAEIKNLSQAARQLLNDKFNIY